MRLQELQPDMITYTLSAERALQASEETQLHGLQHDTIITLWTTESALQERALQDLEVMQMQGFQPDIITYTVTVELVLPFALLAFSAVLLFSFFAAAFTLRSELSQRSLMVFK